jgi:hypothetical protein
MPLDALPTYPEFVGRRDASAVPSAPTFRNPDLGLASIGGPLARPRNRFPAYQMQGQTVAEVELEVQVGPGGWCGVQSAKVEECWWGGDGFNVFMAIVEQRSPAVEACGADGQNASMLRPQVW